MPLPNQNSGNKIILQESSSLAANQRTITYDELYKGWTSFHSYEPEWMTRLGTKFYTFSGGQLYVHDENDRRTSFYGVDYGCSVTYSSNKGPSDIKSYKAVSLETNSSSWFAEIDSELETGEIGTDGNLKFQYKEGFRYGYIRRLANDELDFNKLSVLGLGDITTFTYSTGTNSGLVRFAENIPNQVSIGDLFYHNDGTTTEGGFVITGINGDGMNISGTGVEVGASVGDFGFIAKNSQSESYGVRGYYSKIKLINNDTSFVELFAANSEVFKSYM